MIRSGPRAIAGLRVVLGVLFTGSVLSQSLFAGVALVTMPVPTALAASYPRVPLVYSNLFRAASALMAEMKAAEKPGCLTDAQKDYFAGRVARLEQEIDLQLTRSDAGEFFSGYPNMPVSHKAVQPPMGDGADFTGLPMSGDALGSSPRYNLTDTKTALDQELSALDGMPDCVPFGTPAPGEMGQDMSVPPPPGPGFVFGGFRFGGGDFGGGDPEGGRNFNNNKGRWQK